MYGYVRGKRKVKKALGVARLAALWRDQRLGLLFVFVFCFFWGGNGAKRKGKKKEKKKVYLGGKGGAQSMHRAT